MKLLEMIMQAYAWGKSWMTSRPITLRDDHLLSFFSFSIGKGGERKLNMKKP